MSSYEASMRVKSKIRLNTTTMMMMLLSNFIISLIVLLSEESALITHYICTYNNIVQDTHVHFTVTCFD